jgi:putative nucleotidyltransferase with HDIG domain
LLIDTERGIDWVEPTCPAPADTVVAPLAQPSRASLDQEISRALKICGRAKSAVASMFNDARMGVAVSAEQAGPLIDDIADSVQRNPQALISLSRLKTSDEYTYMHSVAVCALMIAVARQLDMPDAWVREAGMAGLLHDIGKMAIAQDILNKPGRLTDAEFSIVKDHPQSGARILRQSLVNNVAALDVCLHHHEKFDQRVVADGGDLRRLRRSDLGAALQEGLGPGSCDSTHGYLERAFRRAHFSSLRARGRYLPDRRAGALAERTHRPGGRAE